MNVHDESSRSRNFGVGGWEYGRDCPNSELVFRTAFPLGGDAEAQTERVVILKFKGRDVGRFSDGLAMFSPDCKTFWKTGVENRADTYRQIIEAHDAATGELIAKTKGTDPAWSPDSKAIYFPEIDQVDRPRARLIRWVVPDNVLSTVAAVKDWRACYPPGEGVSWWPVRFDKKEIRWEYSSEVKTPKPSPGVGFSTTMILVLDAGTHAVKRIETGWSECELK